MSVPRATVRLQLHAGFPFDAATELVEYFHRLGVSHIYASPLTRARPGSIHGYDTVDYGAVNPELGGEAALRRLVARLREFDMGLIADIVPNHMSTAQENAWWWSVLSLGRHSPYASYFDIDWESDDPALRGKVLAPFLGEPYGVALGSGLLALERASGGNEFQIAYFDARFPIAEAFAAEVETQLKKAARAYDATCAEGCARLHELLERQHYRLAWWRTAAEEINWRRFFELSDLVGMRIECRQVRDAVHELCLRLYAQGLIDGVRVDHVDGLSDPEAYCLYLRKSLVALTSARPASAPRTPPYIVVEKILAAEEILPPAWQVQGTTGYDFMNQVGALLHDPSGEYALTQRWQQLSGEQRGFEQIVHDVRRKLLAQNFAGECEALVKVLHGLARADLVTRDWGAPAIRRVLVELLVFFPVYRTYATVQGRVASDELVFGIAVRRARASLRWAEQPLLDLLAGWLGGQAPIEVGEGAARADRLEAIRRFQQLTAPLAAKAVEDTGFYRYGRLLSRNEVGADPAVFSLDVEAFHHKVLERAVHYPDAMLVCATHDHKRGEDARARLAVLSELSSEWLHLVDGWIRRHAVYKKQAGQQLAPAIADEYMLYQTLFGAWPLDMSSADGEGLKLLAERVGDWQTKSLREAKLRSSWVLPADEYERACNGFLHAVLDTRRNGRTLLEISAFVSRAGAVGALNSLAQTLLRLTVPGVPDLYQGTELWDFSLVDPDNRRAVDYQQRRAFLAVKGGEPELVACWRDGRIKFELIRRTLALRRCVPELFQRGDYLPLPVNGEAREHVLAFARRHQGHTLIIIVPHCAAELVLASSLATPVPHVPELAWGDTSIEVSSLVRDGSLQHVLTGRLANVANGQLAVREALADFPVALLMPAGTVPRAARQA